MKKPYTIRGVAIIATKTLRVLKRQKAVEVAVIIFVGIVVENDCVYYY
jgi:hypothetical protein